MKLYAVMGNKCNFGVHLVLLESLNGVEFFLACSLFCRILFSWRTANMNYPMDTM
jgi:hypothetical protein